MNDNFRKLSNAVENAKIELVLAERGLAVERSMCKHIWDDPNGKYKPDVIPAYRAQSFMGHFVKRRDGTYDAPMVDVPEQVIPKWNRTCTVCGLVETTTVTKENVIKTPVFP